MMSVFGIFFVEIAAFRWGTEKLVAAVATPHETSTDMRSTTLNMPLMVLKESFQTTSRSNSRI
ncbi:hypothetical protein FRC02_005118 [Tulasnella sp. 418]|nr:hypothetical protein FRC02_005118 [Tulasnella sp. 418]